ncbi:hypothetical protein LEP1GSC125_2327 [Leptospira mayottensis 200901122]|uniref:Uncharacterized protein n=1 Tax=Leptospira mayottensis 200901122 TaxID=1193010 RepID=A0AA87SY38_9LEPT|nr:hypothetical protein LEP1GSC125_2327 [Leptospira mayottensis 200901122]
MLQTKKILTVRCSNYCLVRVLEVSASESDRESLLRHDARAVEKDGDLFITILLRKKNWTFSNSSKIE